MTNSENDDEEETNSEFQQSPKGRQTGNSHCCCVHISSQCPNDRFSPINSQNNNGGFAGQPRVKDNDEFDDGIAVRIVNDVSVKNEKYLRKCYLLACNTLGPS